MDISFTKCPFTEKKEAMADLEREQIFQAVSLCPCPFKIHSQCLQIRVTMHACVEFSGAVDHLPSWWLTAMHAVSWIFWGKISALGPTGFFCLCIYQLQAACPAAERLAQHQQAGSSPQHLLTCKVGANSGRTNRTNCPNWSSWSSWPSWSMQLELLQQCDWRCTRHHSHQPIN